MNVVSSLKEEDVDDMAEYLRHLRSQIKLALISPERFNESPAVTNFANRIVAKSRNEGVSTEAVIRTAFKELSEPADMTALKEQARKYIKRQRESKNGI